MSPGQERRIAQAAARKALETADRLSSITDDEIRADFIDAVIVGAADRLRGEGQPDEAVRLWRAVFLGSFSRQAGPGPAWQQQLGA